MLRRQAGGGSRRRADEKSDAGVERARGERGDGGGAHGGRGRALTQLGDDHRPEGQGRQNGGDRCVGEPVAGDERADRDQRRPGDEQREGRAQVVVTGPGGALPGQGPGCVGQEGARQRPPSSGADLQSGAIAAAYAANRALTSSPTMAAASQLDPWARTSSTARWAAPP